MPCIYYNGLLTIRASARGQGWGVWDLTELAGERNDIRVQQSEYINHLRSFSLVADVQQRV